MPMTLRATTPSLDDALAVADADGADIAAVARAASSMRRTCRRSTNCSPAREGRHRVLDGREPVVGRHRQGQQHHQLPPADRPHRPPGMGPFSLTGQPNAMGGREVGGLANMLAAHMELANPLHRDIVQDFWQSPAMADKPGLKAVDLFQAIEQGKVKAVWVIATNPWSACRMPTRAPRAGRCELVVASDIVTDTDTNAAAHVLLPALGWGEKDGTVTNSERRISRQRAFLPAPGEARADWDILCDVARRMGFAGFDYAGQHEIFDEHARSAPGAMAPTTRARAAHVRYRRPGRHGQGRLRRLEPAMAGARRGQRAPHGTTRLFEDGRYAFADGRARFVPTAARAVHAADDEFR
jgi:assimilatory nitrate reductase catalytic subunit